MLTFLSKIHPVCHNITTGIEPGSDSKTTDKHVADCSKVVVICVRCINYICLPDNLAFFVYTGQIPYKLERLKAASP